MIFGYKSSINELTSSGFIISTRGLFVSSMEYTDRQIILYENLLENNIDT